ncbi:MAG: ATP-binding cassette domain-containing protein, partial [Bifidobacterium sp.]|nr:ATP-binding cassette domain-containing protein [Bifidobacterium sp.]
MMTGSRHNPEPVRDNPDQPLLSVRNLSKSFQGLQAVADVNMDLASGQVIGIIGPNGSGKSTTINLICGFLKPDSGQISLKGRTVTGLPATDMAEQGVSRTFQNGRVFPTMSVEENVAVGFHRRLEARRPFRRLERWPILRWIPLLTQTWLTLVPGPACGREAAAERKAVQSEIDRFSERLEEHRTQAAYTLSYANRRRTEIARAHVSSPDILVLDEPTAGMNQSETAEVLQQLLELKAQGQTMLLVEHKIDLIEALCDQVIAMDGGRIIASGPPKQVSADPRVITAYLGDRRPRNDAPMNGQANVLARQNALAPVTATEPIDGQDSDSTGTKLKTKSEASDDNEGKPTTEGDRTLLSLDAVDVSYGPVKALDHVSLRVPQGGIVSLLGGNASGKSTTMKTILGLLAPKEGTIRLDGREITHTPTKDRVRSGIASVPEARRVFAA